MNILGIHGGFYIGQHDASVTLIQNGKVTFSVEEERLIKVKSPRGVEPVEGVRQALKNSNLNIKDVQYISHPGSTYKDIKSRLKSFFIHYFGYCPKIEIVNHQLSHLASSYFYSGFKSATCISYDAYGDRLSGAIAVAKNNKIKILKEIPLDNSLGSYYALFTNYLGFDVAEDEYKVMGMAAYGKKNYNIEKVLSLKNNDYFKLNNSFLNRSKSSPTGNNQGSFYSNKLVKLLGNPRKREEKFNQRHFDIAKSVQEHLENACIRVIKKAIKLTNERNICLSGGVALNCKANGILKKLPEVNNLFVQPAASDRGLSLGCAAYTHVKYSKTKLSPLKNLYLGPRYSKKIIEENLKLCGLKYKKIINPEKLAAKKISEGKVIGWFQGRSEIGPRALGNRSILGDASNKKMKDIINKKVKFREEFRPFAPSCIEQKAKKYFEISDSSPFMTAACFVKEKYQKLLPSITHLDKTARLQTVNKIQNNKYYNLLLEIEKITGFPIVLNTSFNIKGQPIVETPLDAISTYYSTGMDCLFLENFFLEKI